MSRFLPVLLCVLVFGSPTLAQDTARITSFTISELDSHIASLPLPSSVREDLGGLLEQAGRAYDRGASPLSVLLLEQFASAILAQPLNVVPAESAADLARRGSCFSPVSRPSGAISGC